MVIKASRSVDAKKCRDLCCLSFQKEGGVFHECRENVLFSQCPYFRVRALNRLRMRSTILRGMSMIIRVKGGIGV